MTNQGLESRVRLAALPVLFALVAVFGEPRASLAGVPNPTPAARSRRGPQNYVARVGLRPDLHLQGVKITDPPPNEIGWVSVKNVGKKQSPPPVIRVKRQSGQADLKTINTINPGHTASIPIYAKGVPGSGLIVEVVIDPDNAIDEENEGNNTWKRKFSKGSVAGHAPGAVVPKVIDRWSLPDLAISFGPSAKYSAGEFLIQNLGDSPSPTVVVRYRRQSGHFKDETYWPLSPGQTISTSGLGGSDLLLMPGSGPIVQAIVDPEGKVKEKNESNNACWTTMKKSETR